MLKGIIVGIVLGVLLLVAGTYTYFAMGQAPVATASPQMPFERKLANMALHAYLDKLPHAEPAVPADEANFLAGARIYKDHCAFCHGLPGEPKPFVADGMFPKAPQLFHGVGVTDDDPWETYWKVSGGIRMTGMPAFKEHLSDKEMWQVSVLLKNADKISSAVKAELTSSATGATSPAGTPAPGAAATGAGHDHEHHH